jgi:hypothetical protein
LQDAAGGKIGGAFLWGEVVGGDLFSGFTHGSTIAARGRLGQACRVCSPSTRLRGESRVRGTHAFENVWQLGTYRRIAAASAL